MRLVVSIKPNRDLSRAQRSGARNRSRMDCNEQVKD
jgi:hypothetical protein